MHNNNIISITQVDTRHRFGLQSPGPLQPVTLHDHNYTPSANSDSLMSSEQHFPLISSKPFT